MYQFDARRRINFTNKFQRTIAQTLAVGYTLPRFVQIYAVSKFSGCKLRCASLFSFSLRSARDIF